jgi:hypothetical protein
MGRRGVRRLDGGMDPNAKHRPIPNGHRKYPKRPVGATAPRREEEPQADARRWSRDVPRDRRFPRE